jgi:hypothetical protein
MVYDTERGVVGEKVEIREKRLYLDESADPFYDDRNIRYLTALKSDLEAEKKTLAEHELIED